VPQSAASDWQHGYAIDQTGNVVRLSFARCDGVRAAIASYTCLTHNTTIPIPPHAQVPAFKAAYVTAWLRAIQAQTQAPARDVILLDELGFCLGALQGQRG